MDTEDIKNIFIDLMDNGYDVNIFPNTNNAGNEFLITAKGMVNGQPNQRIDGISVQDTLDELVGRLENNGQYRLNIVFELIRNEQN